ncbi:NAD(P)-binding protein [Trametopsis cervina]|nr:NAD(P)-binding protein [Trametopsis cervina]
MASSPRVWLVTGSSSGFGRILVEHALSKGDNVVATLRKPEVLKELQDTTPSNQLLVLKVDVTKPEDIINAFVKAKESFGRVDVVFNNAGYGMSSLVEGTPDDVARAIFETNFWGSTSVSREAVRFFRDENPAGAGGRVIVTSSYVGIVTPPTLGWYSATKHAVEAIHEALAQEMDPSWNIKVSILEPGTFRTLAVDRAVRVPIPDVYINPKPTAGLLKANEMLGHILKPETKLGDAKKAVDKIYELSVMTDPPLRLHLGGDATQQLRLYFQGNLEEVNKYADWSANLVEE